MIKAPLALLCLSTAALAAPLADVWPYKATRQPAGTVEYVYDLSSVKNANATDARAANGDAATDQWLKELPKEVKVRLRPPTGWQLSGARPLETKALAVSFSSVSEDPLPSDDPLERRGRGKMRALLHPDEVKLLPGAEMVLWRVRRIEDGALAAVELDTDRLRRELLTKLQAAVTARLKDAQGDSLEGARMLSARLAVAQACLDASKLSVKDPAILAEAQSQTQQFSQQPELMMPLGFFGWSPALQCSFRRAKVLGQPFDTSRAGYAAPLLLLSLFDADPKLTAAWQKLVSRRQLFFGSSEPEPLGPYRDKASEGVAKALDEMAPFIDTFGMRSPPPPGILTAPSSPFSRFHDSLKGAERLAAIDELWNAAQDGRVQFPPDAVAPIQSLREQTLVALATSDQVKSVQLDAAWRDRLDSAFCALQGQHHDGRDRGGFENGANDDERNELKVRLQVPPLLDVEPMPLVYQRAADALERLHALVTREGLAGSPLQALDNTGGAPIGPQLKRWEQIVRGLAILAAPESAKNADGAPTAAARAFLKGWKSEVSADVRQQLAGPVALEGQRAHAVVVGVGRRELSVGFTGPVASEIVEAASPKIFEINTRAEQRYLVPVLVTAPTMSTATALPRSNAEVRKLVDAAGRVQSEVEGTLAHP